jgi:hypothetical protein
MKKIIVLLVFLMMPFSVIFAGTSFKVAAELKSYNPSSKVASIDMQVTPEQNMSLSLSIYYAESIEKLKTEPSKGFAYANPLLLKNTPDSHSFTLRDINPGKLYFYFLQEDTPNITPYAVITIPGDPVVEKPKPKIQEPSYPPLSNTNTTPTTTVYFNEQYDLRITDHYLGISGLVVSNTARVPVSLSVYLGEDPNNLNLHEQLAYIPVPEPGGFYQWFVQFPQLSPGTEYYFVFKDDLDRNPSSIIGKGVYRFTTLGVKSKTQNISLGGDSPALTDNQGKGGIFSYTYPTGATDPGGINADLSDGGGPLVPCEATGDITTRCRFGHLLQLVTNVFKFAIVLILPIIAIIAAYTGIQMIINRENPVKLASYKGNMLRIIVGIIIILLAWTLVASVLAAIVNEDIRKILLLDLTGL